MTDTDKWYMHIGPLLTGLWEHDLNVSSLAKATGVNPSTLRGYIKRNLTAFDALKKMWTEDGDKPTLTAVFEAMGVNPTELPVPPGPEIDRSIPMDLPEGIDLHSITPEQAAEIHSNTKNCPLCQAARKRKMMHTFKDDNGKPIKNKGGVVSQRFDQSIFKCGTALNFDGTVYESNHCTARQANNAKLRGKKMARAHARA